MKLARHYWIAVAPGGLACEATLAPWRSDAIELLQRQRWEGTRGKPWRRLYREGWRIARVRIVAADGEGNP